MQREPGQSNVAPSARNYLVPLALFIGGCVGWEGRNQYNEWLKPPDHQSSGHQSDIPGHPALKVWKDTEGLGVYVDSDGDNQANFWCSNEFLEELAKPGSSSPPSTDQGSRSTPRSDPRSDSESESVPQEPKGGNDVIDSCTEPVAQTESTPRFQYPTQTLLPLKARTRARGIGSAVWQLQRG
jgi:hypothetical protein